MKMSAYSNGMATPAADTTDNHISLFEHLSQDLPVTLKANPSSSSKTNTHHNGYEKPRNILPWTDFDRKNLYEAFGGALKKMLQYKTGSLDFSGHFDKVFEFSSEPSLTTFMSGWTLKVVDFALATAQEKFENFPRPFIRMVQGDEGNLRSTKKKRRYPDWAGVLKTERPSGQKWRSILPGDTKISFKFKSADIRPLNELQPGHPGDWFWPIRQIFTYCLKAQSRYGYIVTDEEAIVFRVRAIDALQQHCIMEYQAFPFAKDHSDDRFSANEAIWWIHLLAANDWCIKTKYCPLKEESWKRRHGSTVCCPGEMPFPHLYESERTSPADSFLSAPERPQFSFDFGVTSESFNSVGGSFSSLSHRRIGTRRSARLGERAQPCSTSTPAPEATARPKRRKPE
jgi:hypothetical protein